jgi:hypothetical protein
LRVDEAIPSGMGRAEQIRGQRLHPRPSEERRRVLSRYEACAGDGGVAANDEVIPKRATDSGGAFECHSSTLPGDAGRLCQCHARGLVVRRRRTAAVRLRRPTVASAPVGGSWAHRMTTSRPSDAAPESALSRPLRRRCPLVRCSASVTCHRRMRSL